MVLALEAGLMKPYCLENANCGTIRIVEVFVISYYA